MDIEHILNNLRGRVTLGLERKDAIRRRLIDEMHRTPLRAEPAWRLIVQRSFILNRFNLKPMPIIAIFAIMALAGGGSAAAERALPGDLLYPVKVNINEEVRAALTLSTEAKADWETRRAERRVQEVARLAGDRHLSTEARSDVESKFERHASRVKAHIEVLKEVNPERAADLATRLEASLKVHEGILTRVEEASGATSTATSVRPLKLRVRAHLEDAAGVRLQLASSTEGHLSGPNVKTAAEGKINATENFIDSVKRFIGAKTDTASTTAVVAAKVKLTEAEAKLAEAKADLTAEKYQDAFRKAREAHGIAQEAKLLLEVHGRIKIIPKFEFRVHATTTSTSSPDASSPNLRGRMNIEVGL